jgi:hypothetical protein
MKTWTATATAEALPARGARRLDGSGRLLAEATSALLSAGALEHALSRLVRQVAFA